MNCSNGLYRNQVRGWNTPFPAIPVKKHATTAFIALALCMSLYSVRALTQPSGGPYGPILQTWELPQVEGRIYYVAPDGDASQKGEKPDRPTTLESAIEKVVTGDAIIMRGGTYRTGNLVLNQGIIIQPYRDEQPVLKGTMVATQWEDLRNGLWRTSWDRLFPSAPLSWWRKERHGKLTPLHRFNNDMVFVDGRFLQSAGWEGEVDEDTYFIDYDEGKVYIGTDPTDRLVEITAFDAALIRTTGECHGKISDKKGPVIRGLIITQYAYRALEIEGTFPEGLSDESGHGKEVTGTLIEHCVISFCSRVAGYLKGDGLVIRHCKISDTSTEGLYIMSSNDVLLERNIFTRNNIEMITGYYPAAVKIFNQCYRLTCRDNLVMDLPHSNGIWYDVGNVDGRFLNNWVQNVGFARGQIRYENVWPSRNGFFFEISKGAVCAGNVFINCDQGILVLNSSDVKIYQNTLVNSVVSIGRNARSAQGDHFGWHPSTGPDVDERDGHVFVNNLLTADGDFQRPLFRVWQPPSLCEVLKDPLLSQMDYNVYVRSGSAATPLIVWSPSANQFCRENLEDPGELHGLYPDFSASSRYYQGYQGPLFKSSELGNYQLLKAFPASGTATKLPEEISRMLEYKEDMSPHVGAYPPE